MVSPNERRARDSNPQAVAPPHFECGALPVRTSPPMTARRGSWIADPVPSLIGETGFEPATPASRTQCSTGLSYSPNLESRRIRSRMRSINGKRNLSIPDPRPLIHSHNERTGRDSNPRELFTPHDFQSCSLSHSDTCPTRQTEPTPDTVNRDRSADSGHRSGSQPNGGGGIRTHASLSGPTV